MPELLPKKIGRKPVFDKDFEDMLVGYALIMEDKLYGVTQMDMRRIAYQLAVKNNLSNPFKDEKAGRYWLKGFLTRHKQILSMRKLSGMSFARANGFTKERMDDFYDNLEKSTTQKNVRLIAFLIRTRRDYPLSNLNILKQSLGVAKNKLKP